MKYIHYIDQLVNVQRQQHGDENAPWYIARQHPAYGLLYWKIRIRMAWACLTGKADAVRFHENDKPKTGMCMKHGRVMLHDGPCKECRREQTTTYRETSQTNTFGAHNLETELFLEEESRFYKKALGTKLL